MIFYIHTYCCGQDNEVPKKKIYTNRKSVTKGIRDTRRKCREHIAKLTQAGIVSGYWEMLNFLDIPAEPGQQEIANILACLHQNVILSEEINSYDFNQPEQALFSTEQIDEYIRVKGSKGAIT